MTTHSVPTIITIEDLEDFIYEVVGVIDMEEVRQILDVIKQHKYLLEEHK